ncbi:hypothetical protein GUJ93_ZPchr0008g13203 [Zizania palustris]|uniref:Uncharacterized protein n=1 Tax=Zizania palustris TaxID=103762 RepID=A0A8J5QZJ3_ZIZPA|nr:hypothetical protein GUJ93_ZPchr0008g13203 [Zizania palustris]
MWKTMVQMGVCCILKQQKLQFHNHSASVNLAQSKYIDLSLQRLYIVYDFVKHDRLANHLKQVTFPSFQSDGGGHGAVLSFALPGAIRFCTLPSEALFSGGISALADAGSDTDDSPHAFLSSISFDAPTGEERVDGVGASGGGGASLDGERGEAVHEEGEVDGGGLRLEEMDYGRRK